MLTGVGKTRDELELAIGKGVGTINAESAGELDRIAEVARSMNRVARVALRVNPDIDAQTHANIYSARRTVSSLRFVGVHVHIGSQITSAEPLQRAASVLVSLAIDLAEDGFSIEHVDLGGGLGIAYEGRPMITPKEYAAAVVPELKRLGAPVVPEP